MTSWRHFIYCIYIYNTIGWSSISPTLSRQSNWWGVRSCRCLLIFPGFILAILWAVSHAQQCAYASLACLAEWFSRGHTIPQNGRPCWFRKLCLEPSECLTVGQVEHTLLGILLNRLANHKIRAHKVDWENRSESKPFRVEALHLFCSDTSAFVLFLGKVPLASNWSGSNTSTSWRTYGGTLIAELPDSQCCQADLESSI